MFHCCLYYSILFTLPWLSLHNHCNEHKLAQNYHKKAHWITQLYCSSKNKIDTVLIQIHSLFYLPSHWISQGKMNASWLYHIKLLFTTKKHIIHYLTTKSFGKSTILGNLSISSSVYVSSVLGTGLCTGIWWVIFSLISSGILSSGKMCSFCIIWLLNRLLSMDL